MPSARFARRACLVFALAIVPFTPRAADAQSPSTTRMRIRTAAGAPVRGALVGLIDPKGNIVAEGLSNDDGARSLTAPAGRFRVQVRRIGFEPFISEEMSFPRSEDLVLSIVDRAVSLQQVVVTAGARRRSIDADAAALSTVWQEIAKALRSSQLTVKDLAGIGSVHTYRKEIAANGKVIAGDTVVYKLVDARPFGAMEPRLLSIQGYVYGDPIEGWQYFAPDETVLLSDTFAATHCFRVVRDKRRAGQIGMSFEPVAGRKIADITGVLWVEEKSSELREMRFQYVNVNVISKFEAGGQTHFRRMPSGAWIVDAWTLRFPKLETRVGIASYYEIGHFENGGGIVLDSLTTH